MNLRDQILARIDLTPYRAPAVADIMRETRLSFITISGELADLINEGQIDTEQGDGGLTYKRRVPKPVTSPYAPAPLPERSPSGLAYFPSKSPKLQPVWHDYNTPSEKEAIRVCSVPKALGRRELKAMERADKAAKIAAEQKKLAAMKDAKKPHRFASTHNLVAKHLTQPISSFMFAQAAGIDCKKAISMLQNQVKFHRLLVCNGVPKLYYLDGMDPQSAKVEATRFKRLAAFKKNGYDPCQIAKEYAEGSTFREIQAKHGGRIQTLHECVKFTGASLISRAELNLRVSARKRAKRQLAKDNLGVNV